MFNPGMNEKSPLVFFINNSTGLTWNNSCLVLLVHTPSSTKSNITTVTMDNVNELFSKKSCLLFSLCEFDNYGVRNIEQCCCMDIDLRLRYKLELQGL